VDAADRLRRLLLRELQQRMPRVVVVVAEDVAARPLRLLLKYLPRMHRAGPRLQLLRLAVAVDSTLLQCKVCRS